MAYVDIVGNLFVNSGVIPYLNSVGAKGVPIPSTSNVYLADSSIVYKSHYLQVPTDFTFENSENDLKS
jgi:hypothetical protein